MTGYKPQAGDLIEVTAPATGKRVRAFVCGEGDGLRIRYEHGAWDSARDAVDPVLLDRAPTPWPTTPGSTATDGRRWAVLGENKEWLGIKDRGQGVSEACETYTDPDGKVWTKVADCIWVTPVNPQPPPLDFSLTHKPTTPATRGGFDISRRNT